MASRNNANQDSWHGFADFYEKKHSIFQNVSLILRNVPAQNQIRIAAPHFEICFGHGWANFNTQSVQTLSCSGFVASRSSGNHDRWHGFSEFYENPSDL